MSETKHTPYAAFPWRVAERPATGEVGVLDAGGNVLFTLDASDKTLAAFIVRACNAHEELVKALKDVQFANEADLLSPRHAVWPRIKAALAKADDKE